MLLYYLVISVCVSGTCDTYVEDWDLTWEDCIYYAETWGKEGTPSCVYQETLEDY